MAFTEFETDSSKLLVKAVNVLLQTIGEPPVEDEEDFSNIFEAELAATSLIETKREVLSNGWNLNYEEGLTFPVDTGGKIVIPYNVLEITDGTGDLIPLNGLLYSKSAQSHIFETPQTVNVLWDLPFNDIPNALRNYIVKRAARIFQARQIMDTNVYAFTERDEHDALIIAERSDGRLGDFNILTGGAYGSTISGI